MDGISSYIASIDPENHWYAGKSDQEADKQWEADKVALFKRGAVFEQESPAIFDRATHFVASLFKSNEEGVPKIGVTLDGRFKQVTPDQLSGQKFRSKFGLYYLVNPSRVENRLLKWLEYGVSHNKFSDSDDVVNLQALKMVVNSKVVEEVIDLALNKNSEPNLSKTIHDRIVTHLLEHETDFCFRTLSPFVSVNDAVIRLEKQQKKIKEIEDLLSKTTDAAHADDIGDFHPPVRGEGVEKQLINHRLNWELAKVFHEKGDLEKAALHLNQAYAKPGTVAVENSELVFRTSEHVETFHFDDASRPDWPESMPPIDSIVGGLDS